MTPTDDMKRVAVYRFYGCDGSLLYVGMTSDVANRFISHRSLRPWWPSVDPAKTRIAWYDSRREAEAAETAAIVAEKPAHNVSRSGRRTYEQRGIGAGWISISAAAKLLGVTPKALQQSLVADDRRAREWGAEHEGWRYKPLVESAVYQLRRSVVLQKSGHLGP